MSVFYTFLKPISNEELAQKRQQFKASNDLTERTHEKNIVETALDAQDTNSTITSIEEYFNEKGIQFDTSKSNNEFAPVESLALLMAENYPQCKGFYRFIRAQIAKKKYEFSYTPFAISTKEYNATRMVAEKMSSYGLISSLNVSDTSREITGVLTSAPRAINFINGDYLEFYARSVVDQVVKAAADRYGTDYEALSNVHILKSNEKHELDIVFRVGKDVFWAEIKSGKFSDFDCYRHLGILMGVNPDKHILLSAEKTDDEALGISWFYQFYVSNISSFKAKLNEMIDDAFKGDR